LDDWLGHVTVNWQVANLPHAGHRTPRANLLNETKFGTSHKRFIIILSSASHASQ